LAEVVSMLDDDDEFQSAAKKSECLKSGHNISMTSDDDGEDMCANRRKSALRHKAVQCNGCGLWHQITCAGVNDEVYTFLSSHRDERWCCEKCTVNSGNCLEQ